MLLRLSIVAAAMLAVGSAPAAEPLRVGIIGLDTSHVVAFTNAFIKAPPDSPLSGVKVVAAYPAGSDDIEASYSRRAGYTETLAKLGVNMVDSVEQLLPHVDAILLESVDGRPHLAQAKPIFAANAHAAKKIPLFIDKPIAASLADTLEIFRLARESGTPCFSTSSLRYYSDIASVNDDEKRFGDVVGCVSYGPCSLEPHHPDLFWYGVHGVEILFTIMGPGCVSVSCTATDDVHTATGIWNDGRVGTFRGTRSGKTGYGATVFGTKKVGPTEDAEHPRVGGYEPMLVEIVKFFRTGTPPVPPETTINLIAFMQAADESRKRDGATVTIDEVLQQAKAAAK